MRYPVQSGPNGMSGLGQGDLVSGGSHEGYPRTVLGYRVTWCLEDPMRDIPGQSWDIG